MKANPRIRSNEERRRYAKAYYLRHPDKVRSRRKRYKENNPDKYKEILRASQRRYTLRTKFGISDIDYEIMLAGQGGVCKICGGTDGDKRLAVDHDHNTGLVRGLLCGNCNIGLGNFQDSPVLLDKARAYICCQ